MILIAAETIYENIGTGYEKVSFTKGNAYKYLPFDSYDNHKQVIGENGVRIFNNQDFITYFKTSEQWNKERITTKG